MPEKELCVQFLESYLGIIGIHGFEIHTAQDDMGFLITVEIPKENNERIGILKGKKGRNLRLIKSLLRVIGFLERKNPFLIIRLSE
jgi:hypothetical protein